MSIFRTLVEEQPTEASTGEKTMAVVDRVLVGESLVGDGNEVAHIDLIMGPRGSAAKA